MSDVVVIGAGPAGLMAAEVLAGAGHAVSVCEAKPSPARKLLLAGKSGLNLTRDEPPTRFASNYAAPWLAPIIAAFGPAEVMEWARGLGVELFTGSTGRVFPVEMKASPLLRAWLTRLDGLGVQLLRRWHWQGWQGGALASTRPGGGEPFRPQPHSWRSAAPVGPVLGQMPNGCPGLRRGASKWRRFCPPMRRCQWRGRHIWRPFSACR